MLIRTHTGAGNQVTLLTAGGTITAQVTEPASTRNLELLAYTMN
jgi:hypothetical protein